MWILDDFGTILKSTIEAISGVRGCVLQVHPLQMDLLGNVSLFCNRCNYSLVYTLIIACGKHRLIRLNGLNGNNIQ